MKRKTAFIVLLVVFVLVIGIRVFLIFNQAKEKGLFEPQQEEQENLSVEEKLKVVVLISIDGLRGDLVTEQDAPYLYQLAKNGSYTFNAKTLPTSTTLPSHTSMLTGVTQEKHGVTWNNFDETKPLLEVDTLFDYLENKGALGFVSKQKLLYYNGNEEDLTFHFNNGLVTNFLDYVETHVQAQQSLAQFIFIHIRDTDTLGHGNGWGSEEQIEGLKLVDSELEEFVEGFLRGYFEEYDVILIISADHGGLGKTHGKDLPEHLQIPFIVNGEGVSTMEITEEVNVYDATCVVLDIFEVEKGTGLDCETPDGIILD